MKKKKLLSILLCAVLVFAMAVPAFADATPQPRYTPGSFAIWGSALGPEGDASYVLNVSRYQPVPANLQKITLYKHDPSDPNWLSDQTFTVQFASKDSKPRFYSFAGYDAKNRTGYSINMNTSSYGVMLYLDKEDDYRDAEVDLWTKSYNNAKVYNITLPNRNNRSVTVRSYAINAQVFWDNYSAGAAKQYWYCSED